MDEVGRENMIVISLHCFVPCRVLLARQNSSLCINKNKWWIHGRMNLELLDPGVKGGAISVLFQRKPKPPCPPG